MKAFVYRFERKMGLVRQEEQALRHELQVVSAERDRVLEELNRLKSRIDCLEESIRNHQGNFLIPEVGLCKEYLPVLKERFLQMVTELQEAEKRVESARQMVVEKKRETKAFEKLREHDWQEYQYELNREEQKLIDELAMTSNHRKIKAKGM
jgi:flagellar FliJ protein